MPKRYEITFYDKLSADEGNVYTITEDELDQIEEQYSTQGVFHVLFETVEGKRVSIPKGAGYYEADPVS